MIPVALKQKICCPLALCGSVDSGVKTLFVGTQEALKASKVDRSRTFHICVPPPVVLYDRIPRLIGRLDRAVIAHWVSGSMVVGAI